MILPFVRDRTLDMPDPFLQGQSVTHLSGTMQQRGMDPSSVPF